MSSVDSREVCRVASEWSESTFPKPATGPSKATGAPDVPLAGPGDDIRSFVRERGDQSIPDWARATYRFQRRLEEYDGSQPDPPRFTSEWASKTWGNLLSADRDARQWVEGTALLTFTAKTEFPDEGGMIPPVTHYAHLRNSGPARRTALSRTLSEIGQWRSVRVVGVCGSGYLHEHLGIYSSEPVAPDQFKPVIEAHHRNCRLAVPSAHGTGAVSVVNNPDTNAETGLAGYLGMNIPGLDAREDRKLGVLSEAEHRQRGATVLEAGGWKAVDGRRSRSNTNINEP